MEPPGRRQSAPLMTDSHGKFCSSPADQRKKKESGCGGKLGTLGQHCLFHGFSLLCVTSEIMCVQEGSAGIGLAGA